MNKRCRNLEPFVLKDYALGMNLKQLREKYKTTDSTVHKILNKNDIIPNFPLIDSLIGREFNRLMVIEFSHVDKWRNSNWKCRCKCGNPELKIVAARLLWSKKVQSCGCLREETDLLKRFKDITGKKFNKLTVIKKVGTRIGVMAEHPNGKCYPRRDALWECVCDCNGVNTIIVSTNSIIQNNTRSCGCLTDHSGDKNYNWNPNLSQQDRMIKRKMPEVRIWTKSVYKRDNYTCQITGQKGGKICAHHIYNWADYPEKRFDVNNGIILSEKIHILFHRLYGKIKNTPEQFQEFKNRYDLGEWHDYQI